ncbi:MAG: HNH endonuclease [Gammaproteobacteria bacterium]|nr:HNH endonuclease [Gammaproteobacteria bacterium]
MNYRPMAYACQTYKTCVNRTDIPQRTDTDPLKNYSHPDNRKFLYGEQGGTDRLKNLQLPCGYCNSAKGDRGQEYSVARLAA